MMDGTNHTGIETAIHPSSLSQINFNFNEYVYIFSRCINFHDSGNLFKEMCFVCIKFRSRLSVSGIFRVSQNFKGFTYKKMAIKHVGFA